MKEPIPTLKKYKHREFACLEDAEKEIKEINKIKVIKKLKYSHINLTIRNEEKRGPGRPNKDSSNTSYKYFIDTEFSKN